MDPKPPPGWPRIIDALVDLPRGKILALTACLVVLIAFADSSTKAALSIGLLYSFPILVGSVALRRWQMAILVLTCAFLREHLGPWQWEPIALGRLVSSTVVFGSLGFLFNEISRNRRMTVRHYREISEQADLRREAELQMATLAESTPAAILIVDNSGKICFSNRAASELLCVPDGELKRRSVGDFLPTLAEIAGTASDEHAYRTAVNCRGQKADGSSFQASAWFATYPWRDGTRLAAIVTDNSEELRESRETGLESLLKSTRVLVGSVSHEIRNMCAAIAVVHTNLGRMPLVRESEDYAALGSLAKGLERLATIELRTEDEPENTAVDLAAVADEFRIVFEPVAKDASVSLRLSGFYDLPMGGGNHHSLLQVLMNLARNSLRAMQESPVKELTLSASAEGGEILIRVTDSGPGVRDASRLFQAFQHGADSVGLGLFISRALVRTYGGDLYHEPGSPGCTMCIRLKQWTEGAAFGPLNISEIHA